MSDIVISMSDIVQCKIPKNEKKRPDFVGSFYSLLKFFSIFPVLLPYFCSMKGVLSSLWLFLPDFGVKSPYFRDFCGKSAIPAAVDADVLSCDIFLLGEEENELCDLFGKAEAPHRDVFTELFALLH